MRTLIVSFLILFSAGMVATAKPLPPFALQIQSEGQPVLDTPFQLRVQLRAFSAIQQVRLVVELPPGVQLVLGERHWQGSLQQGETRELLLEVVYARFEGRPIQVHAWQGGLGENYSSHAQYVPDSQRNNKATPPAPGHIRQLHGRQVREVPL